MTRPWLRVRLSILGPVSILVPSLARADEPAAVDEVVVVAPQRDPGRTTLSASDVREMPGAFGDPFRAIDALPGTTPLLSGMPYVFVRGAPPNDNGFFVDGIRVPLLFHVGLGPGIVHPALVEAVDVYPGAAPAAYGRFAGAIIAARTKAPQPSFHGAANLRLVDAGALLEAPFAEGAGTALAAARYGYPGVVVSSISDTKLDYWDYQTRATYGLGPRDSVGIFALGSHDFLGHVDNQSRGGIPTTGRTIEDFVSEFHRLDARWDHDTGGAGRIRVGATVGFDRQGAEPVYLTNRSAALRVEIEHDLAPALRLRGGADGRLDAYAFEEGPPRDPREPTAPSSASPPATNVTWGANADVVWRLGSLVEITPGARFDVFESSREGIRDHARVPAVDPRLATRVRLAADVAWLSTAGLAHQYPTLRVGNTPAAVVSGAGFMLESPRRLQRVAQASQGIEIALPEQVTLTATGFLSAWPALSDLTAQCIQIEPPVVAAAPAEGRPVAPVVCASDRLVTGRTMGLELFVRRSLSKRVSGWLSYTLSRSTREAHFATLAGTTAVATVASEYDRTHVLNAIVGYDLGGRWRVGGRFVFYSGAPYSPLSGNVPVPPYNSMRDPPFFRVDTRLEKRWPLGPNGFVAFVFEGQNVTLSKEQSPLGLDCQGDVTAAGGTNACKRATLGPITIPSVGVEASF